jgi:mycothiol synthase
MPARAVELRAPRKDEAAEIAALLNAHSRAVHGTDAVTEIEIERWFGNPTLDPERDLCVAVAPHGALLAYADVSDGGPEKRRYWIDLRLAPGADPAVGDLVVAALERRAAATAAPDALVRGFVAGGDGTSRAVFERRGYRLVRHSLRMEISLAGEPPPPVWPDGVAVRTFSRQDAGRVYAATQEAFVDHWEFEPQPYEEWEHWLLGHDHDPSLWFLAEAGSELAGACLCRPHEAGEPDLGWVAVLGVRRPWRRRGLATALLRQAFRELRARGRSRAGLGVDAENLTGAVALYERAGMSVSRRFDILERGVPS